MNMMASARNRRAIGTLMALMLGAVACSSSSSTSSATPAASPVATSEGGLYSVDIETGQTTLFLGPPEGGSEFAFAPDADLIAFVAEDGDGHPQIFVMNADGTDLHQLTHEAIAGVSSPAWSPDGAQIAFRGRGPDVTYEIHVVDVASGELNRITHEHQDVSELPSWSPDGQTIVFQVGEPPVVRSVDIVTGDTSTIAKDAGLPDVSPDGSQLAFNTWSMAKVTLIDIDGSDRTIIRTHSEMYNAKWSPNGERIAFQSYPDSQVYVYEVATGKRRVAGSSGDIVEWLDDQTLLVLVV